MYVGVFIWGSKNFSHSANNIKLNTTNNTPFLEANLRNNDGHFGEVQRVSLADRIENKDGKLKFSKQYPDPLNRTPTQNSNYGSRKVDMGAQRDHISLEGGFR